MLSLFCGQSQMAAVSAEKRSAACRRLEDIAILGLVPLAATGAVLAASYQYRGILPTGAEILLSLYFSLASEVGRCQWRGLECHIDNELTKLKP